MSDFDPKKLSLVNTSVIPAPKKKTSIPRHRSGEKFLKGPIPWNWLTQAARLPGKALHVAVVTWFQSGMTRAATVRLSSKMLDSLDVNRHAKYRALQSLEEAGLISVDSGNGRLSCVTLLATAQSEEVDDD